eukprot:COSAG02_NODE_7191_length_3127_cov_15.225892_3_plen_139_part_01
MVVLSLQYVPRLMTTGWGRALMKTPLIGQAVGMFAKGYAGIVASELKKCTPSLPHPAPRCTARLQLLGRRQLAGRTPIGRCSRFGTHGLSFTPLVISTRRRPAARGRDDGLGCGCAPGWYDFSPREGNETTSFNKPIAC